MNKARHVVAALVLAPLLLTDVGCKETVTKPDPRTEEELATCKKALDEKDKLIKANDDINARLMRDKNGSKNNELVITSENAILTIKPPGPGQSAPPVDPKAATVAYKEFMDAVGKSRGGIQKCYEAALKKDKSLEGHATKLLLRANFTGTGSFQDMSTEPSLGPAFDACLRTVASKWSVSQSAAVKNFQGPVVLNPT